MPLAALAEWYEVDAPDQSDWSDKRIESFRNFQETDRPLGVLRIESLGVEAKVFSDSLPGALEGGLTWVAGTSLPGSSGNVAIAGHRDSFFRKLEKISEGTIIEVETEREVVVFEVSVTRVVDALDVSPLDPSDSDILTLITCYPFYFKGFAPDRYIVQARRKEPAKPVELAHSTD